MPNLSRKSMDDAFAGFVKTQNKDLSKNIRNIKIMRSYLEVIVNALGDKIGRQSILKTMSMLDQMINYAEGHHFASEDFDEDDNYETEESNEEGGWGDSY